MSSSRSTGITLLLVSMLALSFTSLLPLSVAVATPAPDLQPLPGFTLEGSAPSQTQVMVSLALPLRNTGEMTSMARAVSDPSSPLYRHFLTPRQIKADFLPTQSFDSMMAYLSSSGLKVEMTALDSVIVVQGTASQVQRYLGTGIDVFTNGTYSYYMGSGPSTFGGAYVYATNATFLLAKPALAHTAAVSQPAGNTTFTEGEFPITDLQGVYNATSLYSQGYTGTGETIGILDFYGSPTIANDLRLFDQTFGVPTADFTITPIGPYDPNIGAYFGWSTEISLDVEASHAMAPGASLQLYIGNGALSLADAIAAVVQDDTVTTLSQSFTYPEWYYSESAFVGGPGFNLFNGILADQYYQLGSLEGITFMGATGDGGGSGFSTSPEGNLGYPSDSPFVLAAGGTQTYVSMGANGKANFTQGAWSSIGYVPAYVNSGGGTGGVSILEPKPWYQQGEASPPSFPNGRLSPDVSLQAGVDPATYIVDSGALTGEGGTSESSPLLAGLLALVAQYTGGHLGSMAPFLYAMGNSPSTRSVAFTPVTFGYIIPWVASSSYNLATGWGAPNVGEMARLYKAATAQTGLSVSVEVSGAVDSSGVEYTPGTAMHVSAAVSGASGAPVSSGSFTAYVTTLAGSSQRTPLSYDSATGTWTATMTIGDESGNAYLTVNGTSGGLSGAGMALFFAGYLGSSVGLLATYPYSTAVPLDVPFISTDLDGNPAPAQTLVLSVDSYSILSNQYTTAGSVSLPPALSSIYGTVNDNSLTASYPPGPLTLVLQGGTYGYLPIMNGIDLQGSSIFPQVAAQPGSAAPGQSLTIVATPGAPENLAGLASEETGLSFGFDVSVGSNVTATLYSPSGAAVSSAGLYYQTCAQALRVCGGGAGNINGYLSIPKNSAPGLYTVVLTASYGSYTLGETLNGTFYGQVWVSQGMSEPKVTVTPGTLYEGQTATVVADITYPSGQEVMHGEYAAIVYPQSAAGGLDVLMHEQYAADALIQLSYNASLNKWTGTAVLPSPYSPGTAAEANGDYAGPYAVYVAGISSDGVPTTASPSAAESFFVQPYLYVKGPVSSLAQSSGMAFDGATIAASGSISGDVFLGTTTVSHSNLTIASSQILGTLSLVDSSVTLQAVTGGDLVATGSTITAVDSSFGFLSLESSTVNLVSSSYLQVSPPAPTVQASVKGSTTSSGSLVAYDGQLNLTAAFPGGASVTDIAFSVDGSVVGHVPGTGGQLQGGHVPFDSTSLADGSHTLTVTATQADGIAVSSNVAFNTDNQIASLSSQVTAANATISSLSAKLQSETAAANDMFYLVGVLALIAMVGAIAALRRKPAPPDAGQT